MSLDEKDPYGCHIGIDHPRPLMDHRQARQEYLDLGTQEVTR